MPTVTIDEKGCRGCTLCADICPGDVFEVDEAQHMARVVRTQDCIGCKSCIYVCPSACIEVEGAVEQRPFYRLEENVAFVERFLQAKTTTATLTDADWEEAYKDITATMLSLSRAIEDMVGRGAKALGRQAGTVGASHLPEIYEEPDLPSLMKRLQERYRHAIDFEYSTNGSQVELRLAPCRMYTILEGTGEQVGKAVLCQLFHEYVAGLLRSYTGTIYSYEVPLCGPTCKVTLAPATPRG